MELKENFFYCLHCRLSAEGMGLDLQWDEAGRRHVEGSGAACRSKLSIERHRNGCCRKPVTGRALPRAGDGENREDLRSG